MTNSSSLPIALVIGAGGGIGSAVTRALLVRGDCQVHTISRQADPPVTGVTTHWSCDYTELDIRRVAAELVAMGASLDWVIITNGVLHGDDFGPERSLKQLDAKAMNTVFTANAMVPMLWLSALFPQLKQANRPRVAALSARVGSIGDNQLGGWFSYRGSKAALNMMLQCAAIELHRVNRAASVMAFHPGTTDTGLSKPFQKNVAPEKLFTPEFVAEQLLVLMDKQEPGKELSYLDWAGKPIPW